MGEIGQLHKITKSKTNKVEVLYSVCPCVHHVFYSDFNWLLLSHAYMFICRTIFYTTGHYWSYWPIWYNNHETGVISIQHVIKNLYGFLYLNNSTLSHPPLVEPWFCIHTTSWTFFPLQSPQIFHISHPF